MWIGNCNLKHCYEQRLTSRNRSRIRIREVLLFYDYDYDVSDLVCEAFQLDRKWRRRNGKKSRPITKHEFAVLQVREMGRFSSFPTLIWHIAKTSWMIALVQFSDCRTILTLFHAKKRREKRSHFACLYCFSVNSMLLIQCRYDTKSPRCS